MRSRLIPKQALRFQRSLASGHGGPPDSYGPVKSLVPFGGIRKEKNSYPDRIPGDRIHDVPPKLRNYLDSMAEKPAILPRKEKEVHYWTMGRQIFIGENDRTKILALKAQGLAPPETEGVKFGFEFQFNLILNFEFLGQRSFETFELRYRRLLRSWTRIMRRHCK